ncbi:MAG: InlB B-repeat-containing protein, partial [archaeon]|nr:InlB B-repeat-containing protein [archaeon]
MNKLMISLIVLLTAVAVTTSILPSDGANADAENFGDWAYTVEGDSITVTGYTGTESEIVIPSMIEGKPVTAIGENAFLKNKTISEVTVPGTVTEIRNGAFDRSTVTTVVFDGEGLETIGTQAFFTCTNLVSIQFPDSLETIGQRAFKGCSALTDVGMPASVGKIASEAFSRCTNLESIVIPDGANVNPNSVFDNCENLLDITFAEGIDFVAASSFPNHAFYDKEGNPLDKAELKGNTFHGEKGEPIVMVINTVRTATFMANGEVFSTFVGEMGTPIEIPKEVPTTQGHTFVEWDGYTEGMILTKDVVFEAVYEINQYTITFKADGNVVSSQKMDYGAVIVAPEAPAKEGFVFIAWTGYTEGVTVARNMTFNAEYVPGTFTITYMSDGEEYLKATVEYGSVIKLPAQPTKEGYTFVEWDGYTEGMTVPAKDLVFNAVFEVNIYTIIFMANDEVVTQDKYEYGTVIVAPEAPAKEGYTFVEWDGYTEGMTVPADDMTFVAAYIINIYTASFDVDGEIYAEIEFEYSETIVLPEAPVKEGYTFSNWDGYVEGMTMPAHDVVFEAAFDVNFYRVIFTADEMTVYSEYLAFGDTIIAPEAPAKEGYTFAQWIGFTEGMTVPAEDVMFDAAYTVNTYNVYFMVDGDIYMKLPFDYGTTVTLPEDPEKEGYTFVQWDGYFVDMTMPACDVEFNAVFDINLYTVTFTADGNVVSSKDLEYGAAIVAPEAPEKIGYEFSNWNGYTLGMTVPADNVDFDAVYEVKQFNVDFVSDKAIVDSYLIDFGAVIVLPADPTKDGYTFVEWDNYSEGMTMPAHDIEFVAVFEVNTYTVTFVVDGQAVASGAYDYGSEIVVPADPVKEGHTFVKWDGYTPGMTVPAYNARFNAVFDVNLYLVTFMDEGKVHFEDYFEYGSVIVLPEEPTKEGYTFTGWDGYEEGMTVPAEDVLFDAKYTVNTYRVTFVADDTIVSTEELEYGSVIVAPAAPEKTGYTFSTWEGFTEDMTVPAKDVAFEATYTVNTYSASFMVDGEVYTKLEFDYGTKIVAPEAPEKIGHTFVKWNGFEEGMTMPANDVEFDAEFDVNVYTVIFMADDKVVAQDKYEYGTVISTPEAPAKEGHTFSNWDGYTEGMTVPAEDVTFTAIYTINNYKVSFTVDGELVASGPCP